MSRTKHYLQNGLITKVNDKSVSGLFNLNKFVKKELNYLNVPNFDVCCPPANFERDGGPYTLRRFGGALEYFNGVSWVALTTADITTKVTETQITTKTTTVVKDGSAGVITTVALTDAADTSFEFTFTNASITSTSVIQLTALNSGTGVAVATITSIGTGTCVIRINNVGVAAFNSVLKIHFLIS